MKEEQKQEKIVHTMEEVTPYNVIRIMEYRWALQYCEGMKVMDLGCGTGSGSRILAGRAREVLGVDTSHASIEIAKKTEMPSNVSFKLVVEGQLPFPEESFDVIVANNLIERLYNPDELLIKMARILKPGGIIVVSTVNRLLRLYFWQKPYNELHFREYSPVTLKQQLSKYFKHIEMYGIKTTGPYFRDPFKNMASRKFRLGIYYPVRNFLRGWIRPFFTMVVPRLYPPPGSPLLNYGQKKLAGGSFHLPDVDLETACREVLFVKEGLIKCSEIIALCRKN